VPWKCTTVIVVNWAEIGRSMTDRTFRVQSSLFRSLWTTSSHTSRALTLTPGSCARLAWRHWGILCAYGQDSRGGNKCMFNSRWTLHHHHFKWQLWVGFDIFRTFVHYCPSQHINQCVLGMHIIRIYIRGQNWHRAKLCIYLSIFFLEHCWLRAKTLKLPAANSTSGLSAERVSYQYESTNFAPK
jgi:hypothetical protein